MSLGNYWGMV